MRRLALVALLLACAGPDAPDSAVCQDAIHRICHKPRCSVVDQTLAVGDDCEATLLALTGCGAADFSFTTPSRDRVLGCREPLLRNGDGVNDFPSCQDVSDAFACQDVVTFFGGSP